MDRKRVILLAVLGVSVVAFVVEHVFLAEPESATAATLARPSPPSAQRPKPTNAPLRKASKEDPTLDWLERLPAPGAVRDVFAMRGRFLALKQQNQARGEQLADRNESSRRNPIETFAEQYILQSTIVGPSTHLATVNGWVLQEGDQIDGFELLSVGNTSAEFRHVPTGQKVSIHIEQPTATRRVTTGPSSL